MSAQRNGSISSYLKPTGEAKENTNEPTKTVEDPNPENTTKDTPLKQQNKTQNKRQMSASPPAPTAKRTNPHTSPTNPQTHLAYNDLPATWLQDPPISSTDKRHIQLTYHKGDIFDAPPNTLLIHACNTQGHWGAGIAKAFKDRYPRAYAAHHAFCAKAHNPRSSAVPTGTAQILAPVDAGMEHWVGCVFTSAKYGKAKDKVEEILRNTGGSVEMLLELVRRAGEDGGGVSGVRMCKINSGKFGVPWEKTEEVLKGIVLREGWGGGIEVWEPADD